MTNDEPTMLFVHGAFHGSWVWSELFKQLSVPGWQLQTVDLPSVIADGEARPDLFDDAQTVRRVLESIDGPVVAIAYSYGGIPLTQAAAGMPNVRHLVCRSKRSTGTSHLTLPHGPPAGRGDRRTRPRPSSSPRPRYECPPPGVQSFADAVAGTRACRDHH